MQNKLDINSWKQWHWQSDTRHYSLLLTQNLFNEWIVIRKWRGKYTKIHGIKSSIIKSTHEAEEIFIQENKRRHARGYKITN